MKIDYNKEKQTPFESFKGGEKTFFANMYFDGQNRIIYGTLEPGGSIGLHTHETNSEIIYIIEGNGKVIIDDGEEVLEKGTCHYCPIGHTHSLVNNSDKNLTFFAVVPEA